MECPIEREIEVLLDYCAGKLSPDAAATLERHVDGCAECRQFVAAQSAVWTSLDGFQGPPVSPDFDRRLWARIEQERAGGSWRRLAAGFSWRPALSLALACVLVVLAALIQRPRPAEHTERVDAERIERVLDDVDMLRQLDLEGPSEAM